MELRNASVKLPADLHQQIKDELEAKNITMSQFFEMAAKEHFDKEKGGKTMANGRTLAFTVSEELFQRVKEYLARYERTYHRRLTQKEFVLGLIEDELEKMSGAMEAERQAETADGCGDGDAADEAGGEAALCAPESGAQAEETTGADTVPFPVSWTVKMKKKQKETQDILSYHSQAAGCSDKARAKASGGRQPIEECGRTGL